jgi:hypothetical protein
MEKGRLWRKSEELIAVGSGGWFGGLVLCSWVESIMSVGSIFIQADGFLHADGSFFTTG